MKKTFTLLANLSLEELQNLDNPESSPKLQAFLKQLKADYDKYLHNDNYDVNQKADKWLEIVRDLAWEKHPGVDKGSLGKIERISDLYKSCGEHAFRLLDMYQAIDTVSPESPQQLKSDKIKKVVSDYHAHLEQKLKTKNLSSSLDLKDLTPKEQKLLTRYTAISDLHQNIKDKPLLDKNDEAAARAALDTCLGNKPAWSEGSFLQQLAVTLNLDFKFLYKMTLSFSKEAKLEEKLNETLSTTPKLGD